MLAEINELKKSIEFTKSNLEEKVDDVKKRMEKLMDIPDIYEIKIDPKNVQDKLTE